MIVQDEFETIENGIITQGRTSGTFFFNEGNKEYITLKELQRESKKICDKWSDYICDNSNQINFKIDDDMKFVYKTNDNEVRKADISQFAFSQLCTRIGVPANYIKKCFENDRTDLALVNFKAWAKNYNKPLLIRENGGVVRAVLSDSYKLFDSSKVIRTLCNSVDTQKYKVNGVFLSSDKLHLRFIDEKPLDVKEQSPILDGFTVTSSDVGRGSLAMNYFLYRQVCKNGMTITESRGTLFRQAHIGSKMSNGKLELFNRAFNDIDDLNDLAVDKILKNQEKYLKDYELNMYLEKARRELKLSEKSKDNLVQLINGYGNTRWGMLNGITELAQNFTLEKRLELEAFAGNLMIKVA